MAYKMVMVKTQAAVTAMTLNFLVTARFAKNIAGVTLVNIARLNPKNRLDIVENLDNQEGVGRIQIACSNGSDKIGTFTGHSMV